MMQKCPVCNGSGTVNEHLYTHATTSATNKYVTCKSCNGRGIVRDENPAPVVGIPTNPPAQPSRWGDPDTGTPYPQSPRIYCRGYGYGHRTDGTIVDSDGKIIGTWDPKNYTITNTSGKVIAVAERDDRAFRSYVGNPEIDSEVY